MSLSIGIVGLPNVGKSTLFNALVKARQATASNFAFTTIDPNVGIIDVPDERLQKLADIAHPAKIVPATVKFIDIAGLVKEAHKGEGLGNKFLSHIREVDAICMVLRCFEDSNIMHVAGKIDPKDDFETIKTELELADLEVQERASKKKDNDEPTPLNLLNSKPFIYAANVSEKDSSLSSEQVIKKFNLDFVDDVEKLIVISAKVEEDLIDLEPNEQKEYLELLNVKSRRPAWSGPRPEPTANRLSDRSIGESVGESGLDRLIQSAYHTLGLQSYFTAGPDEVRAWTIRIGDKAPVAAGKIHGDFEKGFIRAEVVSYEDYLKYEGEQGARTQGKLRQEGKDYTMHNGDVVNFLFNV